MIWRVTKDGDIRAWKIYQRHYSCINKKPKIKQFVGPGESIVLVHLTKSWEYDALFVWQKQKDRMDGRSGINCSVFRNESKILSSDMILEAEIFAYNRWPGEKLFTFVNANKINSINPGYCFMKAGWKKAGKTKKSSLIILEK
jgi:hypothetical protein